MPISVPDFQRAARDAEVARGGKAVRSGKFMHSFEEQSQAEFVKLGLTEGKSDEGAVMEYRRNKTALGAHFPKSLDLWYCAEGSGPLLGVSFKSMMREVGKNVNNRWEELVGDAANLHSRYPMLAFGYVMILPFMSITTVDRVIDKKKSKVEIDEPLIDATGTPTALAQSLVQKFRAVRGRRDAIEPASLCEEVALAFFDFSKSPPVLHATFPETRSRLRLDFFFDRMAWHYKNRNAYL